MNKLEACKHLEQAMGLEWLDEKTWNTIFGIKKRLCFCSEENFEDADSLETVWNSIHGRLEDPFLELNLLKTRRRILVTSVVSKPAFLYRGKNICSDFACFQRFLMVSFIYGKLYL